MWLSPRKAGISILERIVLVAGFLLVGAANLAAEQPESAQPFTFEPAGTGAGAQGSMGGPPAPACEAAIIQLTWYPDRKISFLLRHSYLARGCVLS